MHTLLLLIQLKFKLETILIVYKKKHYRLAVFRSKKLSGITKFPFLFLLKNTSFLFRGHINIATLKISFFLRFLCLFLLSLEILSQVDFLILESNCIIYGPRFCKYEFTNLKLYYYYYYFIPIYVYCTVCTVHNHFVLT